MRLRFHLAPLQLRLEFLACPVGPEENRHVPVARLLLRRPLHDVFDHALHLAHLVAAFNHLRAALASGLDEKKKTRFKCNFF